ncbi:MAG: DNA repair protein RecN [Bacteroidales bacterium]|nr:DNA repair protein RecN [Bacteroidales bacterium]
MLKRLLIENYALIDHLDILFPGGLVIITGETGAGKSILLGALSLVLGGRSDVSVLQDPARNCVVEAVFEEEGSERIFRRVVTPQGRSRGFIDDEPASVEMLRAAAGRLVDVHAQHQQLLLSERDFQRTVLDCHAGARDAWAAHRRNYQAWLDARAALQELEARIAASEREHDYLEFQYRQLEAAALREGEMDELDAEQRRLAHSEAVREQLARVEQLFEGSDGSLESRLKEATAALERVAQYFPEFEAFGERLESARIELKDIRDEVSSRGEKVQYDPQRLEAVEERLATLHELLRKFHVGTEAELIAVREELSARLGAGLDDRQACARLRNEVEAAEAACRQSAENLHTLREKAAPGLAARLQEQVRALELPRARFAVQLETGPMGPDGSDEICFLFDANERGLQALSKCASGGELSRIMLCIKALLAEYQGMPTLIFDEIDSGVSGSVAEKMGRLIADMGRRMQVMAITHLPQVASQGCSHLLVYKEDGPQGLRTAIRPLTGEDRVREIARMLSGADITPEALANARVLLDRNKSNNY